MRLTELHLEGFGCLVNRRFRFAPGLNLVAGPNDAGKSTLQQAIVAMLYGLHAEPTGTPEEHALLLALRPWDEGMFYSGSLTYMLDNGQAFRLLRRFLPKPDTLLQTHPEGVDVSGRFRSGPEGQVSLVGEHLGLAKEVFESVCVIRQGGPGRVAAAAVVEALKQQLAAATVDAATTTALERLEAALAQYAADEASNPLSVALERRRRLEEERARLAQTASQAIASAAALEDVSDRLRRLELQREQLVLLQKKAARGGERARPVAADETTAELRRCEAEVARWQAWSDFPAHTRDEILKLSAQRTHLQRECAAAEQRARQAEKALQSLAAEEALLQRRLAEQSGVERPPEEDAQSIRRLADQWQAARTAEVAAQQRLQTAQSALQALEQRLAQERKPLEAAVPLGMSGLAGIQKRLHAARHRLAQARGSLSEATARWARLGLEESQFQELEASLRRGGHMPQADDRQGRSSLSGVLKRLSRSNQASNEAAIYAEAQPLYADLLRFRVEVTAAQQALRDTEATTLWQLGELLGGTLEDSAFAQVSERLAQHLHAAAELEQQTISVTTLQADVERAHLAAAEVERELRQALGHVAEGNADTAQALESFLHPDGRAGRLTDQETERLRLRAEADLELVRLRRQPLEAERQEWRKRQAALAEIETTLRETLAQAGVDASGSLEAAVEACEEAYRNHERWQKAQADLRTAMRWHRALLGIHAEAEEEAARLLEVEASLRALGAWQPGWSTVEPDRPPEGYAPLIEGVDRQLAAAAEERASLQATLDRQTSTWRHLAEVDEELAAAQAEVRRLERFRAAAQLAREELAAASRRYRQNFQPRLELAVYDGLHAVMPGSFGGVTIDPQTLAVTVRVPGSPESLPVSALSGSTRELIQLLLRLAIARVMGQLVESPLLLLDEPLVQADSQRQQRAFDYLAQQAEGLQIVVLTRAERLRARFEEKWASSPLHQLLVME